MWRRGGALPPALGGLGPWTPSSALGAAVLTTRPFPSRDGGRTYLQAPPPLLPRPGPALWSQGRERVRLGPQLGVGGAPNSGDFCNPRPRGHPGLTQRGVPLRSVPKAWLGWLKVSATDAPAPVRDHGPRFEQELAKRTRRESLGRAPADARPRPHSRPRPLTLDLLVDHQGEVVHLQDV